MFGLQPERVTMTKTLRIDLFTDVTCPWCLIGTARLDQAIAQLPEDVEVEVARHPFMLDPRTPAEGVVVADMLRKKYGRDPKQMWERVEEQAHAAGVDLRMETQPMAYNTAAPHTLVRHAPVARQHALASAIANQYFLKGRNTSDPEVLADIAVEHGFDRAEVLRLVTDEAELAETHRLAADAAGQGIQGVPFFIFNNAVAFSGGQPLGVFAQAFEMAMDPAALEAARAQG